MFVSAEDMRLRKVIQTCNNACRDSNKIFLEDICISCVRSYVIFAEMVDKGAGCAHVLLVTSFTNNFDMAKTHYFLLCHRMNDQKFSLDPLKIAYVEKY